MATGYKHYKGIFVLSEKLFQVRSYSKITVYIAY